MRSRNIKPGFFENEKLADLPALTRILFAGLWCYADREGRFEWRPKRIKALILPYDDCNVEEMLMSLHAAKFLYKYGHGTECFGIIPKFAIHQNPHPHEAKSRLPAPPENIEKYQCHDMSLQCNVMSPKCNADSLIPDSLIPIKNSSSKPSRKKVFDPDSNEMRLACLLRDEINARSPNGKPLVAQNTSMQMWARNVDLMIRLDSRDPEEIDRVIRWCQRDNFWQSNILSTGKLREKYAQLLSKMSCVNSRRYEPEYQPTNRPMVHFDD